MVAWADCEREIAVVGCVVSRKADAEKISSMAEANDVEKIYGKKEIVGALEADGSFFPG